MNVPAVKSADLTKNVANDHQGQPPNAAVQSAIDDYIQNVESKLAILNTYVSTRIISVPNLSY